MEPTSSSVLVVDHLRQYVEEVGPAVARYALKANKAQVLYKHPFTIQLAPGIRRCPRPPRDEKRRAPEVVRVERQPMGLMMANHNPAQAVRQFNDFFKNCVDEMVWVRVQQPPGQQGIIQHSMSISDGTNYYRIPPVTVGDPVCLSTYAPFDVLKKSADLRTSVTKGILQLLTTEEADSFFIKKANISGKPVDALRNEAMVREQEFLNHEPLRDPRQPDNPTDRAMHSLSESVRNARTMNSNPVIAEDTVKPYVIHLCQQVSSALKDDECMPSNELLMKLQEIEASLTVDDLEHIRAHGRYKTVKQWATGKQADASKAFEIDDTKPAPKQALI